MATKIEPIDVAVVQAVAAALCDTPGGLTNPGLVEVFTSLGVSTPLPATKRVRVSDTLLAIQH